MSDVRFAFWDIMPTLAEIAGGTADAGIDGVSIVPTLMGQVQPPKEYLYWTWDGSGCEVRQRKTPLRGRWRVVWWDVVGCVGRVCGRGGRRSGW